MIGRKREVEIKRQRGRDKERENRVVSQGAVGCAGYTDFLQEKNGLQKRLLGSGNVLALTHTA